MENEGKIKDKNPKKLKKNRKIKNMRGASLSYIQRTDGLTIIYITCGALLIAYVAAIFLFLIIPEVASLV